MLRTEERCRGCERDVKAHFSAERHRQFGILITTSYVDVQAYREIKEDKHPIIVISAVDIVNLLRTNGYSDAPSIRAWLQREFRNSVWEPYQQTGTYLVCRHSA